jgi:aspartate/methionine/tyrosine aminotransferase
MQRRFGVSLDPFREVLPLIGSKEGIFHLPFALLDAGDVTIIPDPGYQAYFGGTVLAGGEPFTSSRCGRRTISSSRWTRSRTTLPHARRSST